MDISYITTFSYIYCKTILKGWIGQTSSGTRSREEECLAHQVNADPFPNFPL
jgi:hypothetical protein